MLAEATLVFWQIRGNASPTLVFLSSLIFLTITLEAVRSEVEKQDP